MTVLTAHKALRVNAQNVVDLPPRSEVEISNASSTGFTANLPNGIEIRFGGYNINFERSSGTVTSAVVFKNDVKFYSLSDFAVSIAAFPDNLLRIFDGADRFNGSFFADIIYGLNGADTLFGNAGADTLYGGKGADTLRGGAYDDRLWGGSGRDTLFGGVDHDRLIGGTFHDVLKGEGGEDRFSFVDPIRSGVTFDAWDEIVDFNPYADSIGLEGSVFTALRSTAGTSVGVLRASQFSTGTDNAANQLDDRIVYNKATGELWYDSNGSAANTSSSVRMKIAELDLGFDHPQAVSAADFILV